jgi:hypothetical protein
MGFGEYIISICTLFLDFIEDIKNGAGNLLDEYGGIEN